MTKAKTSDMGSAVLYMRLNDDSHRSSRMKCPIGHEAGTEKFEKVVIMKYRSPKEDLKSRLLGLTTQDFLICPTCGTVFKPS